MHSSHGDTRSAAVRASVVRWRAGHRAIVSTPRPRHSRPERCVRHAEGRAPGGRRGYDAPARQSRPRGHQGQPDVADSDCRTRRSMSRQPSGAALMAQVPDTKPCRRRRAWRQDRERTFVPIDVPSRTGGSETGTSPGLPIHEHGTFHRTHAGSFTVEDETAVNGAKARHRMPDTRWRRVGEMAGNQVTGHEAHGARPQQTRAVENAVAAQHFREACKAGEGTIIMGMISS